MSLNILHCLSSIDKFDGGPSRSVPLTCKGLSEMGININLLTYNTPQINKETLIDTNVNLIALKPESGFFSNLLSLNAQKEICENIGKIDILHNQGMWLPLYHWAILIARRNKKPYIITPRGCLEPHCINTKSLKKEISMRLYQKEDLQKADCIIATGELEANNIRNLGIKAPIAIIPNGIDLSIYPKTPNKTPNKPKRKLLYLSRITPKKGLDLLIESWRVLNEDIHKEWELAIVGNGEKNYIDSLNEKINFYQLNNSIKIFPPAFGTEKEKIYQSSDLFILPSHSENFGMVIAEAMAHGLPVITTRNTPWESLERSHSGWWIDLNPNNLSSVLTHALSLSSADLKHMGENGKQHINNFSIENTCRKTKELYYWLSGNKQKPDFVI